MAYKTIIVRVDRRRTRPHDPATDSVAFTSLKIGGSAGTEVTNTNVIVTDNTKTFTNKTFDAEGTGNSLSNITNSNVKAAAGIIESKLTLDYATATLNTAIGLNTTHRGLTSGNPHSVTKTEIGLSNVTNDAQLALTGGTMSGAIAMGSNKITGLDTPTSAGDAATKSYVDQLAITGGVLKEALLLSEQMDDTDGINAAETAYVVDYSNVAPNDTFIIKDAGTTETFVFKAAESAPFDVAIGASNAACMTNLAAAINADSVKWDAKYTVDGLDSINADGVVVIYEKASASGASTSRIYGVIAAGQVNIKVVEYNGEIEYKTSKTAINLPAADPAAVRFGLRKQATALVNGELHLALESDVILSWDDDGNSWLTMSGSGSLPDATSGSGGATKGKLTADSDKGLVLASGVLAVTVDASTINFSGGVLYVPNLGIDTAQLAAVSVTAAKLGSDVAGTGLTGGNGSALAVDFGVAGSKAVSATDLASTANAKGASLIGIEDSGAVITATTVETALVENRNAIDAIEDNAITSPNSTISVGGTVGADNQTVDVATDGVNETHIRLQNDAYLNARNNADNGDVNILKVTASDAILMATHFLTPSSAPTTDYMTANKKYIDDAILGIQLRSYTASGWTHGTGTQAIKGDIGFLDTDDKVKMAESGVTDITKKRIVICYDATINNDASGNWIALPSTAVGDDSGMTTTVIGEEVYLSSTLGHATQNIDSITATEPIILLGYGAASNDWEFIRPEYIGDA